MKIRFLSFFLSLGLLVSSFGFLNGSAPEPEGWEARLGDAPAAPAVAEVSPLAFADDKRNVILISSEGREFSIPVSGISKLRSILLDNMLSEGFDEGKDEEYTLPFAKTMTLGRIRTLIGLIGEDGMIDNERFVALVDSWMGKPGNLEVLSELLLAASFLDSNFLTELFAEQFILNLRHFNGKTGDALDALRRLLDCDALSSKHSYLPSLLNGRFETECQPSLFEYSSQIQIPAVKRSKSTRRADNVPILSLSSDGNCMALLYRGGKTIRLFDISKGHDPIELEPLNSEEDDAFMCLSWSPVGKILAIGGRRGRIYFMDMSDYTRPNLLTVVVHGDGGVHDLSWSADGRRILSCNYDRTFRDHTGTAKVWDVSTPASAREVLCLSNEEGIESAVMSGDGEKAVTITSGDAFGFNMTNWDISDPASPSMISVIRFDTELDFRTRFVFLVANYRDIMVVFNNGCAHQFLLVNPATGKTIAEIPHPADRFIDNDPFKDYSYNPVIPFRFGQYVICSCPGRIVHLDDPYHDIVTLDHGAGRCKTGTLAYAPTSATIAVSYNFNKGLFGSYGFVDIYRAPTLLEFIAQHTR